MGIAEGIITLIATLAPIGVKLFAGQITEEEARKQSRDAVDAFAAQLTQRQVVTLRSLEADAGWLALAVAFALLPLVVVLWAVVGVALC
jgi:hypothetical protein